MKLAKTVTLAGWGTVLLYEKELSRLRLFNLEQR